MGKNNHKKKHFERWLISSIILFFIGSFGIIFIGAPYDRGVEFSLTILYTTISPLFTSVLIVLVTLLILNIKLPPIKNIRNLPQVLYFFFFALGVMLFVYFLMGEFIFNSLFATFLPEKPLLVKSLFLVGMIVILAYRISLYFVGIFPRKVEDLYNKTKREIKQLIKKRAPWFELNSSQYFSGKNFIEKIRNVTFDFLAITFLLSFLAIFYGTSNKPDLSIFVISRLGVFIAISIEIWFWYGLVQKRYWK